MAAGVTQSDNAAGPEFLPTFGSIAETLAFLLSAGGAEQSLTYTDVPGAHGPGVFTSWTELYAAYQQLEGPVTIRFVPAGPSMTIPDVGVYNFARGDIFSGTSVGQNMELFLADGVVLRNVYAYVNSILLRTQCTLAPALEWDGLPPGFQATIVVFQTGSGIRNDGTFPAIVWDKDFTVDGVFALAGIQRSSFDTGLAPILDVTPAGAFNSLALLFMSGASTWQDGTLTGSPGALLITPINDPGSQVSTLQPGWLGTSVLGSPSVFQSRVNSAVRFSESDFVLAQGPYTAGKYPASFDGDEYVRVAPDGTLIPCDVALPFASTAPGIVITVKRVNPDVLTAVNVLAALGDLIDGAPTSAVPLTPFAYRRFVCDGFAWHAEGSGI